jgi:hypothetical protein
MYDKQKALEKAQIAFIKCCEQVTATPDSQKAAHFAQAAQYLSNADVNLSTSEAGCSVKQPCEVKKKQ